jgi:hypothetical protein
MPNMELGGYEYIVTSYPATLTPSARDANESEIGAAVGQVTQEAVQKACSASETSFEGDWEFVSHDVVLLGRFLVTTFLLRRPKQQILEN